MRKEHVRLFAVVCSLSLLLASSPVLAQDSLSFWLVFNLPSADATAEGDLDEFLETWFERGVDLYGVRTRASSDATFRRQLFGQVELLRQVADFRAQSESSPRIEITFFTWDNYWESLISASGGLQPDLLQIPTTWCSSLAKGLDKLIPLPEDVAQSAVEQFPNRLLRPCLVYGQAPLFGLPWLVDVRVMYYWKADLPSLDAELRNSRHVRDTFAHVLRLSQPTVNHPVFGFSTARDWELLHQTALLVWGEGGDLVETSELWRYHWSSASLEEPALRGALFLVDLARDGTMALPREPRQDLEVDFRNHQIGSIVSGPWLLQSLPPDDDRFRDSIGMTIPPFYDRDPVTFIGGSFLGFTGVRPALRRAAVDLARYLSSGAGALPTAMAAGLMPASTKARGTATDAVGKRAALRAGTACTTYFECLVALNHPDEFPETLERALNAGRTYPALPDWSKIEAPSRLGSLYHFWQELAALQSRESLAASVQAIAEEWNGALLSFHRTARTIGQVTGLLAASAGGVFWFLRRPHAVLESQHLELENKYDALFTTIEAIRDKSLARIPASDNLDDLKDLLLGLKHWLEASPLNGRPETPRHKPKTSHGPRYRLVLPRVGGQLQVIDLRAGRAIDSSEIAAGRIVEYVVRRSLLRRHPIDFSILIGALDLWPTPNMLPTNPLSRWEITVAQMRACFKSGSNDVISRGRHGIYRFLLKESDYECVLGGQHDPTDQDALSFADVVRDPFLRATKLAESDPAAALREALEAFSAEEGLTAKDLEVVILVCRLVKVAGVHLKGSDGVLVEEAERELASAMRKYRTFFDGYTSPTDLLRRDGRIVDRAGSELIEHWEQLQRTFHEIQAVSSGPLPDSHDLPPRVAQAWREAREMIEQRGPKLALGDERFLERYEVILKHWNDTGARDNPRIIGLCQELCRNDADRGELKVWVEQFVPGQVLEALKDQEPEALLARTLDEVLTDDLWRAVQDERPHGLLALASGGSREKELRIAAELRTQSRPPELGGFVEAIVRASKVEPLTKGTQ